MEKSLTVVLPIHNAERTLREDVNAVLEASAELSSCVEVLVVDDGSTDDSFETATELSIEYPQVRVLRRTGQGGLAEALREIRAGVSSDVVIVHDGASRVNAEQLRRIWTQQQVLGGMAGDQGGVSFADLRRPAAIQPAMENAHRRLLGFQRMKVERSSTQGVKKRTAKPSPPAKADSAKTSSLERLDKSSHPAPARKAGVGVIPMLPAMPNSMFGAITDFARGE